MRKKVFHYIIEVSILIGMFIVFIIINCNINNRHEMLNENITDYVFRNDMTKVDGDMFFLKGWCYRKRTDTPSLDTDYAKNFSVVLFDESAEINDVDDLEMATIYLDTQRTAREDINEQYGSKEDYKYDYTYCGYETSIDLSTIDYLNADYVIAFRYGDKDNHLLRTKSHIKDILENVNR